MDILPEAHHAHNGIQTTSYIHLLRRNATQTASVDHVLFNFRDGPHVILGFATVFLRERNALLQISDSSSRFSTKFLQTVSLHPSSTHAATPSPTLQLAVLSFALPIRRSVPSLPPFDGKLCNPGAATATAARPRNRKSYRTACNSAYRPDRLPSSSSIPIGPNVRLSSYSRSHEAKCCDCCGCEHHQISRFEARRRGFRGRWKHVCLRAGRARSDE